MELQETPPNGGRYRDEYLEEITKLLTDMLN